MRANTLTFSRCKLAGATKLNHLIPGETMALYYCALLTAPVFVTALRLMALSRLMTCSCLPKWSCSARYLCQQCHTFC